MVATTTDQSVETAHNLRSGNWAEVVCFLEPASPCGVVAIDDVVDPQVVGWPNIAVVPQIAGVRCDGHG